MKIGIVGTGFVGSTAAYAMIMNGVGREIVLVDLNQQRAEAEADDLYHAVPFAHPLEVRTGDYADLTGCRVVVLTAGVAQKPGETRLELLKRNAGVFRHIVPAVLQHEPNAILVVATNPVDIMTHLAAEFAQDFGLAEGRVIGSGTTLDTARFRSLLGRHFGVDAHHCHAYVIGEHGDSEVLTWSLATIAGLKLDDFCRVQGKPIGNEKKQEIDQRVRRAAYNIIEGKGATYYGIGSALARIVKTILHDQRAVLSICTPMREIAGVENVTLAMPHVVGGRGAITQIPLPLDADESAALHNSASIIRSALDSLAPEA